MNILHTISDLSIQSGGPTTCTYTLLKGLRQKGVSVDVLTYTPKNPHNSLVGNDSFIKTVPSPKELRLAYSPKFRSFLKTEVDYDLYHINGIWQYPSHITAKYARSKKKPYIISPHGMLYLNTLEKSRIIKKIFLNIWFQKDLNNAACIHATGDEEMRQLRLSGFKNPIAIIPNPIELSVNYNTDSEVNIDDKNSVTFIGRLVSIKRIDNLIKAWSIVGDEKYVLQIAGSGELDNDLKDLAKKLNIKNIKFLGFLNDKEKEKLYRKTRFLVLPSESENFGMVVTEALLNKVPVLASKGTPWQDLEKYECGWWVKNDVDTLAEAIKNALYISDDKVKQMGNNGKQLVVEKYSSEIVTEKMKELYTWILKGGERPDFVFL